MPVGRLHKKGIVKIATEAADNPKELCESFCLGIAGKDYPAKTPLLWNQAFEHFGMKTRNIRLVANCEEIDAVVSALKTDKRYVGGDIGIGFKDKIVPFLDHCDPIANVMQAVNVVSLRDGKLIGHNTDGVGFAVSLEEILATKGREVKGENVLLLGGGGTTNAIAFALCERGAIVVILNRTVSKAEDLVNRLNDYFGENVARAGGRNKIAEEAPKAGTIVSAIDDPYLMLDQYSALGAIELPATTENIDQNLEEARKILASLPASTVVADVMLRNQETATLRTAREAGLTTLDGHPMVFYQAVEAFWLVNHCELEKRGKTKTEVAKAMKSAVKN
jgi:shikimate dehydrogenase